MKFSQEDLITVIDGGSDTFEIIEEGDWISEGKYEVQEIIFKFEDKFYCLAHGRSGSYFTDWFYDVVEGNHDGECSEVEKIEVIAHEWRCV